MENPYTDRIEAKLGFDKIRKMIAARCSGEYGAERAASENFSTREDTITRRLDLTDEMRTISMFEPSFPSAGYVDSIRFLKPLETPSSYLTKESLQKLRTSEETLRGILAFFRNSKPGAYPNLSEMASSVQYFPEIGRRIDAILDKYGEIRDSASTTLSAIRKSIREKENSVSKRTEAILKRAQADGYADADASVSIRDGRALIPVSAYNKKKISGFIVDESSTGKTVFIEPAEVVELNNQIKELHFEEQREIIRILVEFSDFIRPYLPEMIEAAKFIGEIDFIRAKALCALEMEAGKPVISSYGEVKLLKARHPLLERSLKKENKEIVPLTMTLDSRKHILLISGPNAGGKSVCLKTVGLLQYMLQFGMLIPASESSEIRLFDRIFIDIGDEQSIENDLSTYSSHLLNMKNMLAEADNNTLVLIDEFGSGTEPAAGGAIAEAILEEIERRGTYGVITTHYTNLKFYASNSSGVINGAMMFDVKNIQPLFKLETGLPGNSFAFELARKMGLPENIIKSAEDKAGNEFVDIERNLRKIARSRRELDKKLERIKSTDRTLESITDKYQKELTDIQSTRKSIIEEAKKEAREILSEANRKIETTIKEIRETQAEKEKTKLLRQSLKEFTETVDGGTSSEEEERIARKIAKLKERQEKQQERKRAREKEQPKKEEPVKDNSPITAGDKVRILSNGMAGEVILVDRKKLIVSVGDIKTALTPDKVEKISKNEYTDTIRKGMAGRKTVYNDFGVSQRRLEFKSSIDIRGYRLADALDVVSRLIDDALMFDIGQVKILHGKGNGILKEEIRKYLRTCPGVTDCRDEAVDQGGSGITVVTLG